MSKGSNKNVGSIEEDIKILENLKSYLNLLVYEGKDKIIYNDLLWDEKTVDCINTIEHLINNYTRQKQINEEHQKINGELREKVKELEDKYILEKVAKEEVEELLEDSIPKQKIKDKLEEINKKYENSKDENGESPYYYPDFTIRILQELLGGERK